MRSPFLVAILVPTLAVGTTLPFPALARADGDPEPEASPTWGDLSGEATTPSPTGGTAESTATPAADAQGWSHLVGATVTVRTDAGETYTGKVTADMGANVSIDVPGVGLRVLAKSRVAEVTKVQAGPESSPAPEGPAPAEATAPPPEAPSAWSSNAAEAAQIKAGPHGKKFKTGGTVAGVGAIVLLGGVIPLVYGLTREEEDENRVPAIAGGAVLMGSGYATLLAGLIVRSRARNRHRAEAAAAAAATAATP